MKCAAGFGQCRKRLGRAHFAIHPDAGDVFGRGRQRCQGDNRERQDCEVESDSRRLHGCVPPSTVWSSILASCGHTVSRILARHACQHGSSSWVEVARRQRAKANAVSAELVEAGDGHGNRRRLRTTCGSCDYVSVGADRRTRSHRRQRFDRPPPLSLTHLR